MEEEEGLQARSNGDASGGHAVNLDGTSAAVPSVLDAIAGFGLRQFCALSGPALGPTRGTPHAASDTEAEKSCKSGH